MRRVTCVKGYGGYEIRGTLSWDEYLVVHDRYVQRNWQNDSFRLFDQERLAELGGFSYNAATDFLGHPPRSWIAEPRAAKARRPAKPRASRKRKEGGRGVVSRLGGVMSDKATVPTDDFIKNPGAAFGEATDYTVIELIDAIKDPTGLFQLAVHQPVKVRHQLPDGTGIREYAIRLITGTGDDNARRDATEDDVRDDGRKDDVRKDVAVHKDDGRKDDVRKDGAVHKDSHRKDDPKSP